MSTNQELDDDKTLVHENGTENGAVGIDDNGIEEDEASGEETTKKVPFFLPSVQEFADETVKHYKMTNLALGPLKLEHLSAPHIKACMEAARQFTIHFKNDDDEGLCGHVILHFESEGRACEEMRKLESKLDGLVIKHLKPVNNIDVDLSDIRKWSQLDKPDVKKLYKRGERAVAVLGMPEDVTKDEITEKFPTAVNVLLPVSFVTDEQKNYAYVELPSKDEQAKLNNTKVTLGTNETKCLVKELDVVPQVEIIINRINKLKQALSGKGQLPDRNYVMQLFRQGLHYERCDYLKEEKRESLNNAMQILRNGIANYKKRSGVKRGRGGYARSYSAHGRYVGGKGGQGYYNSPSDYYGYYDPSAYYDGYGYNNRSGYRYQRGRAGMAYGGGYY